MTSESSTIIEERLNNVHPGEILLEEFLKPMQFSSYRLAKETGIPATRISQIIHSRRSITADTALRFSRFFGTSPEFWLGLQNAYDIEEVERAKASELDSIALYQYA